MNEGVNKTKDILHIVKTGMGVELFINFNQQIIITTEDKLKICLDENLKKAEKKYDWIAPLGILIAIIIAFVTATFKNIIFSSETWKAIFFIGGITTFIWLIIALKHAFVKINSDHIISDIKTSQTDSEKQSHVFTELRTVIEKFFNIEH